MKEYELLRAEIVSNCTGIWQHETVLHTVVVAILAFTIESNKYYICLLPHIIIISVFLKVMSIKYGTCKIATYMIVFLEGKEFTWETRHALFDMKNDPRRKNPFTLKYRTNAQYYLLAMTCSLIAIIKLLNNPVYDRRYKIITTLLICIFTGIIFYVFHLNSFEYSRSKSEMVKKWRRIKNKAHVRDA